VADPHPLDPLSPLEIERAVAIARDSLQLGEQTRFCLTCLREPEKEELRGGGEVPREVVMAMIDPDGPTATEAVVSLSEGKLSSQRELGVAEPPITLDELDIATEAIAADPRWQAAVERRGIDDPSQVGIETHAVGTAYAERFPGRRLGGAIAFLRRDADDNYWAHPIANLGAIVDLISGEVMAVDDGEALPIPAEDARYTDDALPSPREDLRPIEVTQPEGVSFEVDGYRLSWAGWSVRVGWGREGLVLHDVTFDDGDEVRGLLYRASISDVVVPYGDPSPGINDYGPHDIGEWPWGKNANSLKLGCDCLGAIHYLDMAAADGHGEVIEIENAVCIHEEDAGVLYKHHDRDNDRHHVRRNRRLVISSFYTLGNYDYGIYWHLYLDGTIEVELKLTGIVFTTARTPESADWGEEIMPGVNAPIHQHFFCARLDFDLDGVANTVFEIDTNAEPAGPTNPLGNAMRVSRSPVEREAVAALSPDWRRSRYWLVANEERRNRFGKPVAYKLMPSENAGSLASPDSDLDRRARFIDPPLRVTRYERDELFAAGWYPNQRVEPDDIAHRQERRDAELRGEDVVVWYTMGAHHVVRPEDWPLMPVTTIGFMLRPVGFFDTNPAMRVPAAEQGGSCHAHAEHHEGGA
jgi:primary-amine oxidase